jgi:hypothetical protein
MGLVQNAARHRILVGADLLQDLETTWLGQGPRDSRELAIRQSYRPHALWSG